MSAVARPLLEHRYADTAAGFRPVDDLNLAGDTFDDLIVVLPAFGLRRYPQPGGVGVAPGPEVLASPGREQQATSLAQAARR